MKFEQITPQNRAYYRAFLFPQVISRVADAEQDDGTMVAIGAYEADGMAETRYYGAIAGVLEINGDIEILGICVDAAFQRQGIGRMLFDRLLRVAAECGGGQIRDAVMVKLGYVLPPQEITGFEAFLEAIGFTEFFHNQITYVISQEKLRAHPLIQQAAQRGKSMYLQTFAGWKDELTQEEYEFLLSCTGAADTIDEEASLFCMDPQSRSTAGILVVRDGVAGSLVTEILMVAEDQKPWVAGAMLAACIDACGTGGEASMVMSVPEGELERYLRGISGDPAERYLYHIAGCNCTFESKTEPTEE